MRKFLSAQYWVHLLVSTVIGQLIWWVISMIVGTPILVRSIIAAVVLVATVFAVALYLPKLSPKLSGASTEKKREINEKSWLYQFLEADKNELEKRIHQFRERWLFNNIYATEPFMEVIIQIVNAAVFPITIKGVEGSFAIQGTKCNWDATVSQSRIPHGESSNICISQRLLKETVDIMVKLHNERHGFTIDLNSCRLVIQADEPNMENKLVKIPLHIREQVVINT
jgi:hypothetical protein